MTASNRGLFFVSLAVLLLACQAHPERKATKAESLMNEETFGRAELFFRSMDADRNGLLSKDDVNSASLQLAQNAPGITPEMFNAFIDVADTNKDGTLDRTEFMNAMESGLTAFALEKERAKGVSKQDKEVEAANNAVAEFVETDAKTNRKGWITKLMGLGKALAKKLKTNLYGGFRQYTGKVYEGNDACVMCQYILERCELNVHRAGIFPGAAMTNSHDGDVSSFIEEKTRIEPWSGPMQVQSDYAIEGTRETTRAQRQVERQRFNEIWRVVDVTLDDVCEESMPNVYYGFCKMVYQQQSQVVEGLRYQYRAADICYRIGACQDGSYITRGVHSRYPDTKKR